MHFKDSKMCETLVQKIACCLEVPPGKLTFDDEKVFTRTSNDQTVRGLATVLYVLAQESQTEAARNSYSSPAVGPQVYQWIEFATMHVAHGETNKHVAQQLLRDLNKLFLKNSYLVGHFITIADLAVFFNIYDLMKSLSPVDKENYLNLSRWFDHMQQRPEVRKAGYELLNFTTIYLHGWATGTHI